MKKQVAALILVMCSLALPAWAQPPLQERSGTWWLSFSGVPFAKVWVGLRENEAGGYHVEGSLKSIGVARIFKVVKTDIGAHLALRDGIPRTRTMRLKPREKSDTITELQYDEAGALTHRLVQPQDDIAWRPLVPDAMVHNAYSWFGLLFALQRDHAQGLLASGQDAQTYRLYDGKRLLDLTFTPQGGVVLGQGEQAMPAEKLLLTRRYVAGYTPKEQAKWEKGEAPLYVFLRASDGFPIRAELPLPYGTVTAVWEKEN